jgi:protein SCO1
MSDSRVTFRRGLLWGLLVLTLLLVAGAALFQKLRPAEPPPLAFGRVPDFQLTNRDGRTVRLSDLAGKPWIADFVFTRCPASCPIMTTRMAALNRELSDDLDFRLVSISVDPEHDTPEVLRRYAESFQAPDDWLFLTGGRDEIFHLSKEGFKLGIDDNPAPAPDGEPQPEPILHSTRFVLVDGEGEIRGYYNAFSDEDLEKLERDLKAIAE